MTWIEHLLQLLLVWQFAPHSLQSGVHMVPCPDPFYFPSVPTPASANTLLCDLQKVPLGIWSCLIHMETHEGLRVGIPRQPQPDFRSQGQTGVGPWKSYIFAHFRPVSWGIIFALELPMGSHTGWLFTGNFNSCSASSPFLHSNLVSPESTPLNRSLVHESSPHMSSQNLTHLGRYCLSPIQNLWGRNPILQMWEWRLRRATWLLKVHSASKLQHLTPASSCPVLGGAPASKSFSFTLLIST